MFQHYKKNLQLGNGISIVDNVISATGGGGGGSYTAGTNIDITNNVISTIGDTIKPLTDLTINIYELSNGIYSVGNGQTLRCKSDNTKNINVSCSGKLIVSIYPSTNERIFYLFGGYNNTSTLIGGTATSSQGNYSIMNVGAQEIYSTSEQVVGTWINGKPLYEKTFTITSLPQVTTDGTVVDTKTNIGANVNYAFIKFAFAIAGNTTFPNYQTLPYINNAGRQLKSQITNNDDALAVNIISNGTAYNNYYMVVAVVNYTKSTD